MTNLDSALKKQRHHFADKCLHCSGYGFSSSHVWMWELDCEEGWAPKNWCFWTAVLKTLESPLDCKEIQLVILKEINPEHSLKGPMMELKLQFFNHVMRKTDLFEKKPWCWERLRAGGKGEHRGWNGWMASPTWWTWAWVSSRSWTGKPDGLQSMELKRVGHDSDWTIRIHLKPFSSLV